MGNENNETQTEPKTALHKPQLKEPPKVEVKRYQHKENPSTLEVFQFKIGMLLDDISKFITTDFDASQGDDEGCFMITLTKGEVPIEVIDGSWVFKDTNGLFGVIDTHHFETHYQEVEETEGTTPAAKPEAKHYKTTVEAIQFFTGMEAQAVNDFIDCDANYDDGELNVIDSNANVKDVFNGDFILKNLEGECVVIREKEFKMSFVAQDYVAPAMSTLTDEQEDLLEHLDGMIIATITKMTAKYCTPAEIKELGKMWADVYNLRDIYEPEFAPHAIAADTSDEVEGDEDDSVEGDDDDLGYF